MKYVQYADGWNAAARIAEENYPTLPSNYVECPYDVETQRLSYDLWQQGFHDAVEQVERHFETDCVAEMPERITIESFQEIEE